VGHLLEDIVEGADSSHVEPSNIEERRIGEGWAASSRRSWWVVLSCGPHLQHGKTIWGHLHEETMEGEDFSHVDHSAIMVRHCREGVGHLVEEILEGGDFSHVDHHHHG
jgi:hypothetical protein